MARLTFGFAALLALASLSAADWPQWRGPDRGNKVSDFTAPQTWPKQLTQKWKVKVGDGVASPVLVGDTVFVFSRQGGDEVLMAIDAENGKVRWSEKNPAGAIGGAASGFQGPRGTPAVADGKVCTFGVDGVVSCHDVKDGKLAWRKETKGTPGFKTSYSPLLGDGKCVIHAGGSGGKGGGKGGGGGAKGPGNLVAFHLNDGSEAWKLEIDPPGYASSVLMKVKDTQIVVAMTEQGAVGVGLKDGKKHFQRPFKAVKYGNTVTPIVDGNRLIVSAQGGGTLALKVEPEGDGFKIEKLWESEQSPHMYNSPILRGDRIYGLAGSGRGASNLYCLDASTGDVLWVDKTSRGQCGSVLDAGSVLLALSSDANLLAFKPSDKGYEELAKIKVSDSETWAVPIITGKRVFVKDKDSLILWTFE